MLFEVQKLLIHIGIQESCDLVKRINHIGACPSMIFGWIEDILIYYSESLQFVFQHY